MNPGDLFEASVHRLLDAAYGPNEHFTHSCGLSQERCIAHVLLRSYQLEHTDDTCDAMTLIAWRWLQAHEEAVP